MGELVALQPFSILELHPFNTYYSHRARPPVSSSDKGGDREMAMSHLSHGNFWNLNAPYS